MQQILSLMFLCMKMFKILSYKQDGQNKKFILLASLISLLFVFPGTASTVFPCKDTLYPEVCQSLTLSSTDRSTPATAGDMFDLSLKFTIDQAHSIRSLINNATRLHKKSNTKADSALEDCAELLEHSLYQLGKIQNHDKATLSSEDVQTWLSSAITHQTTCLDTVSKENDVFYATLQNNIKHSSNSLALHRSIVTREQKTMKGGGTRKLLSDELPTWVLPKDRKLLEASVEKIEFNAVVAADGTGTHKSIADAINSVSLAGGGRTVIHVTAGTYTESSLNVPLSKSNVMLVGDGKGVTVITGSKSVGGGSSTVSSATFGVSGDGFIARDISFVNTAGPAKHQAVALLVTSDKSVFFRCSIDGNQDTLYALSNRQFYRECDISGTVDFIFGNAAAVFQNCNIFAKKYSERNFITAQGRSDPNQNTGTSIHKCTISGQGETYFGRPWHQYSRTVIMQSSVGSINSAGWYPWSGNSYLKTLYYGEYMNTGPGASTSGRVKWPGYHAALSPTEAAQFTVTGLISGNSWLPSTGVIFDAGL